MSEVASLGFAINTGDVKRAGDDLRGMEAAGARAEKQTESLEDAAKRLGVSVEEMRRRVAAAGETLLIGGKSADKLSESMSDVADETASANKVLADQTRLMSQVNSSYKAANDNSREASRGVAGFAESVLAAAAHLKLAAVAAYALVPALRPIFHSVVLGGLSAVRTGIAAVGTASTTAGTALAQWSFGAALAGQGAARLAPAATLAANGLLATGTALSSATGAAGGLFSMVTGLMSVLSRIAGPILLLVTLWKGFNALLDQGSALLEKYGKESRSLDDTNLATNLEKLTKLQNDDKNVSAAQAKAAAELSTRLEDANFKLKQFVETQVNLNGLALFFQRIWVNIVETVAQAADNFVKILTIMLKIAAVPIRIGAGIVQSVTPGSVADAEDPGIAGRRDQMRREAEEADRRAATDRAMQRIRTQIAMGQGSKAGDPDAEQSQIAETTTSRFNNAIKDLVDGGKKAEEETKKLTDAFDKAYLAAKRTAAGVEADAASVGLSVGEHAKMKMELQLLEVAMESVKKASDEELTDSEAKTLAMKEYGDRIGEISKRYGEASQAAAQAKAGNEALFNLQTVFLSDVEKQIATVQKQLHGNHWKDFVDDGLSATIRLTETLKTLKGGLDQLFSGLIQAAFEKGNFEQAAADVMKRVGVSLIDGLVKQLTSQLLSKVSGSLIGGLSEGATLSASATSASSILMAAGTTVAASIVAGATEAASILGLTIPAAAAALPVAGAAAGAEVAVSGAATGVELAAGGAAAGAALAAGGAAAGSAIYGPIAILIAAIALIGGSFLLGKSGEDPVKKAQENFAKMTNEVHNFNEAASGFDTSSLVTAIQSIESTTKNLVQAAVAAGDVAAAVQLIQSAFRQINNTIDQFIKPKDMSDSASKIASTNDTAKQLIDEIGSLNSQFHVGINKTAEILKAAADQVEAIQNKVKSSLQADINSALDKGFINDVQALVDKLKQFKNEQSITGADTSLIDRWFAVQAQKVIDGANLAGDAFRDLVTMFPDLTDKVHESTAAIEEQAKAQKALQDANNAVAKNVVDFLQGLKSGSSSTYSPVETMTNARAAFLANLPLAQSGNPDAQTKFTQLADDLLKASRAVNASSQAFQDDLNMVINTGLGLPAVQNATDPVVVEMRNVLAAIQANGATQALDATMRNEVRTAINAGNAQAIAALLVPKFDQLDTTGKGALNFSEFVAGLGPGYAALATDTRVAGLLTDSQLRAAGIPVNGPITDAQLRAAGIDVTGPITAGQLANAGLLTGQGLLDAHILTDAQLRAANIPVGGPVTDAQLRAAGVPVSGPLTDTQLRAVGIGVVGPLTETQITNLGLSKEQGNVLNVFRELDGNGNGVLERQEATRAATDGVYQAQLWVNGNVIATAHAANETKDTVGTGNSILSAIQGLQAIGNSTLQTLRDAFVASPLGFNAGAPASPPPTSNSDPVITTLRKIVYNTGITAANVYSLGGKFAWPTFAQGGIAPPGMPVIYAEHSPGGPRVGMFDRPVAITPNVPMMSGDPAMLACLNMLVSQMAALQAMVAAKGDQITSAVVRKSDEEQETVDDMGRRLAYTWTQKLKEAA